MSDLQERRVDDQEPGVDAASDEIARSLGTVWQRFSGQRPESTKVQMGEDVVKCVIQERHEPEPDDEQPDDPRLSPAGLKQSATAAIARITGRKVVAFIAKRDKSAQVSTQTFLLDRPRQRF
ncbi:MAG TPA: hypothetical protein VH391_04490 [Solirubrobacterales bacterium]